MGKDKKYVRDRNKLIPSAVRHADYMVIREGWESVEHFNDRWNAVYHSKMNQLWAKK